MITCIRKIHSDRQTTAERERHQRAEICAITFQQYYHLSRGRKQSLERGLVFFANGQILKIRALATVHRAGMFAGKSQLGEGGLMLALRPPQPFSRYDNTTPLPRGWRW